MFASDEPKTPKRASQNSKSTRILWVEAGAFSLLIFLSWLTELIRIPHLIYGEDFHPNWYRATLRSVVMLLIWGWVHLATRKLLRRLHYLEEFVRVCGWCRKVCYDGEWLGMERFFNSKFSTKTSHGMCPDCLRKSVEELSAREKPATTTLDLPAIKEEPPAASPCLGSP